MRRGEGSDDDDDDEEASRQDAASSSRGATDEMEVDGFGRPFGINTKEKDNPDLRKGIRSKYRDLINSIQQDREDMLNPTSNKLTELLDEANKLFKNVCQSREAALDSQLLVAATDLGKQKANQLFSDSNNFDLSAFSEHLLTFMGLNRLENEEESQGDDGYLPRDAWSRLAERTQSCFRTAPTFHYMMGSFLAEPPPPKQRVERQKKTANKEAKRIMPTQLSKMEESHQEATEKEVERILGYLKSYFAEDSTTPIPYYEFVIDPDSFSRTVENMFHTSFLIRDGLARIYLDDGKLPCIAPVVFGAEEGAAEDEVTARNNQCIVSISMKLWRELIDLLDITEPMIQPHNRE